MRILSIGMLTLATWLSATASPAAQPNSIDFNRDIRPILSDTCFHCHGPDKGRRKADLRLDQEEAARKVIVAGQLDKSALIRRITSSDPAQRMPPASAPRKLSNEQIDLLKRWVEQGAKWQKHWAFVPPIRPELPAVKSEKWALNPIDRFILARLEKEGLSPSSRAALTTLIRRVSLDLTGLPPTPEQVEEFVRESAKDPQKAYEKLVDRLLASPRYGERMAWRWLEAARYADTHGYQTDGPRDMYRWRDWVIDAYNRNLPFDQFTIEQLAGDMLPNATLDQKIATGFNRNHRGNSEGGIVPEEYAVEYVVDRIETTSTVWLGLTLGCARCHDHKYDPFSQKEFYQLFAFFNSIPEKGRAVKIGNSPPLIKAPTKEHERCREELTNRAREAEMRYAARHDEIIAALNRWAEKADRKLPDWNIDEGLVGDFKLDDNASCRIRDGSVKPIKGKSLDFDGKGFADLGDVGEFGFDDRFTLAFRIASRNGNGAILSRMPEEPNADGYSVHLVDGRIQVHLTKRWLDDALRVETIEALPTRGTGHVVVRYDGSRTAAGTEIFIDGRAARTKVLLDELNQSFNTKEPLRLGTGGGPGTRFNGVIGDVRVYRHWLNSEEIASLAPTSSLSDIIAKAEASRTDAESAKLLQFFLNRAAPESIRETYTAKLKAREDLRQFEASIPTVMIMEELPKPFDAHVLIRGEYDKRGEKVARAVPTHLAPLARHLPNNRLGLAKWLVEPKNPLTARVAVNRIWQLHFGTGLVKTGEDFGTQGEYPSHPELLDWLATEFVRTGWDVKKMHKLIVMSATYQQSSRITKELQAKDPDNRLLARGPRYRMSAEMVRDQALSASGLLVEKLGGPSVKPYQPAGLWKELSGSDDYQQDQGENLYRRSLYTFWKRTSAPPSLMTFDASGRETCWVRETRTNTPLQALTLLNDVTYVEAARLLAERVIKEEKSADARIRRAFQLVVSRPPSDVEQLILGQALDQQLADYRKEPEAAKKLLRIGEKRADAKIDANELAAYAQVCNLILNLDESVTKE